MPRKEKYKPKYRNNITAKVKSEAIRYAETYDDESAAVKYNISKECISKWRMGEDVPVERVYYDKDPYDREKVIICGNVIKSHDIHIEQNVKPIQTETNYQIKNVESEENANDINEKLKNSVLKCDKIMELLNGFRDVLINHKCFKKSLINAKEMKRIEKLNNEYEKYIQNDHISDDTNINDDDYEDIEKDDSESNDNEFVNKNYENKSVSNTIRNKPKVIAEDSAVIDDLELNTKEISIEKSLQNNEGKDLNGEEITIDYSKYKYINGVKHYFCNIPECTYKVKNRQHLKEHILAIHYGIMQHICKYCGKTFKHDYLLKSHFTVHSEKTIECPWPGCESRFASKKILKSHYDSQHLREKTFECSWPGCGYKSHFNRIKAHMKSHKKDTFYECSWPGCDAKYLYRSSLDDHYKSHTGEKKRYRCDWPGCEYASHHSRMIRDHKRSHIGIKEFTCSWSNCGKKFIRKCSMEKHMKIHTGEKNYKCDWPGCEYRSIHRSHINRHRRCIHEKNK